MKRHSLKLLLVAGMSAIIIAGVGIVCYASTSASATDSTQESREPREDDGSVMAKITGIDGDTLTIVTSQGRGGHGRGGALAEGETPPESLAEGETPPEKSEGEAATNESRPEPPADGETPPEKPEGDATTDESRPEPPADGETPPERPEGKTGDRQREMGEMEFDGETSTVTLTSSTTITKGMDSETASSSDLAEGTVARIVLDGSTVVSIRIME
ncbi:MAG: hypothetical protein LIO81_10615 [Clostridiales bacterium]|nr:hypothetical protein [Clostridiales bacterium]